MSKLKELSLRIHAVSVMRELLDNPVIKSLLNFLDLPEDAAASKRIDAYTDFVYELYMTGAETLSEYIERIVFESENICVKTKGKGGVPSAVPGQSLYEDLKTFDEIASLSSQTLTEAFADYKFMPKFRKYCKYYIKRLTYISYGCIMLEK